MKNLEDDPVYHAGKIKAMLDDLITYVRQDARKVNEPKAEILFETTVEVLGGLKSAYDNYENKLEPELK